MADESTQNAENTAPVIEQGQEKSKPQNGKVYDVDVSFPPVVTMHHIQAYKTGQKRYEKAVTLAGEEPDEEMLSRYYGAKELVDRGFVHIKGLDEVIAALSDKNQAAVSAEIVTWMVIHVAYPFEGKLASPLAWRPLSKK